MEEIEIRAKTLFLAFRRFDARIQAKCDEQQRYRELAMKCTTSYSGMPGGSGGAQSKVESGVFNILRVEGEINREIDALVEYRRFAQGIITQIEDNRYRDVLVFRYFSCWPWTKIMDAMGYESTQMWRIHGRALLAAQEIIDRCSEDDKAYMRRIIREQPKKE